MFSVAIVCVCNAVAATNWESVNGVLCGCAVTARVVVGVLVASGTIVTDNCADVTDATCDAVCVCNVDDGCVDGTPLVGI